MTTFGVAPQDAGVASATVNVGQQLGASIGGALRRSGPLTQAGPPSQAAGEAGHGEIAGIR